MPANDREVWNYLRGDVETPTELDFISYSIYAFEKYDWVEQFEKDTGHIPSQADIDQWISHITPNRFNSIRKAAAELFDIAARRYLADEIAEERQHAVDTSILDAVKSASAFWKQAALALITAILAPLIIGGMILAVGAYDHFYPTATDVSRALPPRAEPAAPPQH
jgi:hypothetical protein